ncbi:hypothetical protein [Candidatus Magnetomonas plexicatena]|uniref:hypothetical protein n=1 Tax=Candidatus Magnetomonas plexicatena TaxID=2552947 RepID=UPI001C76BEB7|nr:hypothetical protein E2O03_008260 [Nitrospirales bacterium LBB_01]
MKEILIILSTFDLNHPVTRKNIEYIKKTDISRAELFIADSGYETQERLSKRIKAYMAYADGRPVVILKSGVIIKDYSWLDKLTNTAELSGAAIVGCVNVNEKTLKKTYGYSVTDKAAHIALEYVNSDLPFTYVPAVLPGLIYIANPVDIEIDENFDSNLYVTDMCVNAWSNGKKVAASMSLEILDDSSFDEANPEHFRNKWCYFIKAQLFLNEDIKNLKSSVMDER